MSDSLGPITIPDPPSITAFPLKADYGAGVDHEPKIAIHVFDQPGLKTEQRYLLGPGTRRFRFQRDHLSCTEYDQLKAHWLQAQGQYAVFSYAHPSPAGTDIVVAARYENPNIQFQHLVALMASNQGLTLLEVPTVTPAYTSTAHVTRFPDSALTTALLSQVQQFIPLIKIQARGTGASALYISDQRVTVDGQLYLPRLAAWNGIAQSMSEASDNAQFTFGNADDIWTQYGNAVNLFRARISFSLYHVNSHYFIDLWSGYARPWSLTSDGLFVLPASDGVFELTLSYPVRQVSRTCWKIFKGPFCPSTSTIPGDCPKDFAACTARGVPKSFGGVVALSQSVSIKDNSTGVFGYGRSTITSVSIADDSVYQRPIQEVYTDKEMKVVCDVAMGRDESEFYSAIGVVGEGPIGSYSPNLSLHTLDGQPCHDPAHGGGWRGILGADPAGTSDFFQLDQAPWNVVPAQSTYAGGLAFAEIRRTDAAGLQLTVVHDRDMVVTVAQGISGWTWTAPGARVWTVGLSNTVWVAINVYLRALGLRVLPSNASSIPAAVMEQFFDVNQAIAAAAICDQDVISMIVPGLHERQFPFRGALKERKPLKDWLQEILNCCLGYFTFVNGKLWIGCRINSSSLNAFTRGNILYKSLQAAPVMPQFNWLTGQFGDEEFDWALNSVTLYDIDHATFLGETNGSTQYLQSSMNFVGVSNKSQCARIITTRLREELGGLGPTEQLNARNLRFRTTLLALASQVGDVISVTSPRLPGGIIENRIRSWQLNPDYSIDIEGTCTTDKMYDLTQGPKPADVPATPVILELLPSINGLAWMPNLIAPFAGDPLYPDLAERTFDIWQEYKITSDGIWSPAIFVSGELVINTFAQQVQPRIVGAYLTTGGSLAGPMTVYIAVGQHASSGFSVPSNLIALWIPAGTTGQAVHLDLIAAGGTWTDWDLYAGTDRRRIALQSTATAALPASTVFNGPIHPMTRELPEAAARRVRIAAKKIWHAGVVGVEITSVPTANTIQCDDFRTSTDNWLGRKLSALADASDGSAPLWNFTVTAFDNTTGTFTVTPNCVRAAPEDSVQPGDIMVVRSTATAADVNYIEDSMWNNSVANLEFTTVGLRPDEETDRLVRILRGTGAGQVRNISGNTNTRLFVEPNWDVVPDNTSIAIVEAPDWTYFAHTSDTDIPQAATVFEMRMAMDNLVGEIVLVGGFLVDDQDRVTDEEFAVFREIWIYGQSPTVHYVVAAETTYDVGPDDHTVRVDTTSHDITVQLPFLIDYEGRELKIFNDGAIGTHNVTVRAQTGETLMDGNTSVTLGPQTMMRITSG